MPFNKSFNDDSFDRSIQDTDWGPYIECTKHGTCRMNCTSPCNTKRLKTQQKPTPPPPIQP